MLSNAFGKWLKMHGVYHLTAPRREPNYNAVVERSSAVLAREHGICNAPSCREAEKLVGLRF